LISTLSHQVVEEECGAKKVSRKNPRELKMGRDKVEAKIIVSRLTTSSYKCSLELVFNVNLVSVAN
jgi:hypothetical protein